jgi:polyferredoxin
MESVGLPKGLIRYASEVEIVNKEKFVFNTRMKGYASVLLILTGVFIGMLFLRNDVEATILHLPGQLFEHKGEKISNVYTFKVVNKTEHDFNNVYFKLVSPKGEIKLVGKDHFTVKKQALSEGTMFIEIDQSFLKGDKTTLQIEVYNDKELIDNETTNFLGPRSFN